MQSIERALTDALGPLGLPMALCGVGIVLILSVVPFLLQRKPDPMERLGRRATSGAEPVAGPSLRGERKNEKLERYRSFLEPQNTAVLSARRLRLVRAGYRGPNAVRLFHLSQFALGLAGLVGGTVYALLAAGHEASLQAALLQAVLPGAVGYFAPKYWVARRLEVRREAIINGFPDSLDLMLVCIEAGQSMDQAVARVAREIHAGHPDLGDEFRIVADEMRAGKERSQVLRDMGERVGVPDIANFVTVLVQSAAFGTSVTDALRVYAAEMRDKRVMRAEEKANKLPTKMTLATMMLTVPPLLLMLLSPSIHQITVTLGGLRAGGF